MSRAEVMSTHSGYGKSRIPRRVPVSTPVQAGADDAGGPKPSRLELMQADFQERRLREREAKLIHMYEDNQSRALSKVNSQHGGNGMVRDFFRERRDLDKVSGGSMRPTVDQLFKQRQMEYQQSLNPESRSNVNKASKQGRYIKHDSLSSLKQNKRSAGRDRSNLLAPIEKPADQNNRHFPRKPQLVRPRTLKELSTRNERVTPQEPIPKSAPVPSSMSALGRLDNDEYDETPTPNPKQLQQLQQKRKVLQRQKSKGSFMAEQSTSKQSKTPNDFQQWQVEQDKAREERLVRHRNKSRVTNDSPPNDEGFEDDTQHRDDLKRQQELLMAQIEKQQQELLKLRADRIKAEEEEAVEKERQKREAADEKRRRKEEEIRHEQEEERRVASQLEQDKVRKMNSEKQRMRRMSESRRRQFANEDSDDEDLDQYMRKQPAPPDGPKPKHTRNVQSRPTPSVFSRARPTPGPSVLSRARPPPSTEPGPPPSGAHTAIYEIADKLEGAYEKLPDLATCFNCGRNFAVDRLDKHEKFCKNATTKRKVMDPSKTRTRGTEMEQFIRHRKPSPKPKKNHWRAQHESFMKSIEHAKKLTLIEKQGGDTSLLTPPPPTENPDYVECPYCTRRFNPQTAERHIPHCKNTKSRPAAPPRHAR